MALVVLVQAHQVPMVRLVQQDHRVTKVLKASLEITEPMVPMVRLVQQDHRVTKVLKASLEITEPMVLMVLRVPMVQQANKENKDRQV
jgi:hypothetical protein